MIENIQKPKAVALMYKSYHDSYGFSKRELSDFIRLLLIPAFFDVLITKYENHIEFMIDVAKTDNGFLKNQRARLFNSIMEIMHGIVYESMTTTYAKGENYDCLTAKCMLDAINK